MSLKYAMVVAKRAPRAGTYHYFVRGQREVPPPPCMSAFFFTLVTGPRRSLSLELSDTRVHEPQIRFAPTV